MRRFALTVVLVALVAGSGWAAHRAMRASAVLAVCDPSGNWESALSVEADLSDLADPAVRLARECRCRALYATKNGRACVDEMLAALFTPEGRDWVPERPLTLRLIAVFARGERQRAVELAVRASDAAPADAELLLLAVTHRLAVEDEATVLRDAAKRVERLPGPEQSPFRMRLATRWIARGGLDEAERLVGGVPAGDEWYRIKAEIAADRGDAAALRAVEGQWKEHGNAALAAGWTAFYADVARLAESGASVVALRSALDGLPEEADPELREGLYVRLAGALALRGDAASATSVVEEARARGFPLAYLDLADLGRSAVSPVRGAEAGRLVFASPVPGSVRLSHGEGVPPDLPWEELPISSTVEAMRAPESFPVRWVFRDESGGVRASGATWPVEGGETVIAIQAGEVVETPASTPIARPADGTRRTFVVVLDCFDWRLVSYLRERGELPTFEHLLRTGWHAVLRQEPALTAAAMDALVHPVPRGAETVLTAISDLGVELAGLESVGRNPLAPLGALLPHRPDLFAALGAGSDAAGNLLFAHGDIEAGRNAQITGPAGAVRAFTLPSTERSLRDDERRAFTSEADLARLDAADRLLRAIAAQFDTLDTLAADPSTARWIVRVEATDILTHGFFGDTTRARQDDGRTALFDVYRYADRRLGEFASRLDADDTLIVMSDHGIRTAMRHDESAVFAMVGPGVPFGRAEGTPALRGVGRVVAALAGLPPDFPDTGVAPWLTLATAEPDG